MTGVVLIAVVNGGSVELLSRPKPLRLEWRNAAEAKVLGTFQREGEGIYIWLQVAGADELRAYVLPWDVQMAPQLQMAMHKGQANGTDVHMSMPFDPDLDDREAKRYAAPQPALPDKNYSSGNNTLIYQQSCN